MNSAADVAKKLLHDAHVVVVPGEAFGTREHIRLSYATSMKEVRARPGADEEVFRVAVTPINHQGHKGHEGFLIWILPFVFFVSFVV